MIFINHFLASCNSGCRREEILPSVHRCCSSTYFLSIYLDLIKSAGIKGAFFNIIRCVFIRKRNSHCLTRLQKIDMLICDAANCVGRKISHCLACLIVRYQTRFIFTCPPGTPQNIFRSCRHIFLIPNLERESHIHIVGPGHLLLEQNLTVLVRRQVKAHMQV